MRLLKVIRPDKLAESLLTRENVKKRLMVGAALFTASIILITWVSIFFIEEKIEARFELAGLENLAPPIPNPVQILVSRIAYMGIALLVIFVVLRFSLYFTKTEEPRTKALLALILNSFLVFLAVIAIIWFMIAAQPKAPYAIVEADFANVSFQDVKFTGYSEQGAVSLSAPVMSAEYIRVFRAYPDMKSPEWGRMDAEALKKALGETLTIFNMSRVRWVENGEEKTLKRLDLSKGTWSQFSYRETVNAVWVSVGPALVTQIFSTGSSIGWGLLALYAVIGFMRLYGTSMAMTVITWIILYFLLFLAGII